MKISEALRLAAEEQLWDGGEGGLLSEFSCSAVNAAAAYTQQEIDDLRAFLEKLGCPPSSPLAFNEFLRGEARQGARFLWLHFAALIAEEQALD